MTSAAGEGAISANHSSSNSQNGNHAIATQAPEENEEDVGESGNSLARIVTEERARQAETVEVETSFSSTYGKIKEIVPRDEGQRITPAISLLVEPASPTSTDGSPSIPDDTSSLQVQPDGYAYSCHLLTMFRDHTNLVRVAILLRYALPPARTFLPRLDPLSRGVFMLETTLRPQYLAPALRHS